MELVQEVYERLKEKDIVWPEQAVIAVRDEDGEIKFSSVGKHDVALSPTGVYMRGNHCLFNNRLVPSVYFEAGSKGRPDVLLRSEYFNYYYSKETK